MQSEPGSGWQDEHQHADDDSLHEAFEQAAMFAIAGIGLLANSLLLAAILLRPRTRRLSSAFVGHSALLNLVMSAYCLPFGRGLVANGGGVSSGACNSLGTSYIVLMTTAAFNLVAMACCEVYFFDSRQAAEGRQPEGSVCCVLFGVVLVYTGSAILHLGPTLIGANFQASTGAGAVGPSPVGRTGEKCLFVYGQVKNYVVYTMWVLIVSLALLAAAYYLVVFRRTIGRTIGAKLAFHRARAGSGQPPLDQPAENFARRIGQLASAKYNRQRVLAGLWCLHLICWYPLYALILMDPQYRVTVELYKFLTILGFARAAVEPMALLVFDGDFGRLPLRLCRCCRCCRRDTASRRCCCCCCCWLRSDDGMERRSTLSFSAQPPALLPPPPQSSSQRFRRPPGGSASVDEVVVVFGDRRRHQQWLEDDGDDGCSCDHALRTQPLPTQEVWASPGRSAPPDASLQWQRRLHRPTPPPPPPPQLLLASSSGAASVSSTGSAAAYFSPMSVV